MNIIELKLKSPSLE